MINLFLASLLALGATTPASNAQPASGSTERVKPTKATEKKYCMTLDAAPGSRVEKVQCKTKSQWAWDGVKIDQRD